MSWAASANFSSRRSKLDFAEDVTGIAMQFARHRIQQRLWCWRPCDRPRCAPSPARPRRRPAAWRRAARPRARCHRAADPSAPCDRPASAARRTARAPYSRCPRTSNRLRQASRTRRSAWPCRRAPASPCQRELALGRPPTIRFRTTTRRRRRRVWSSHSAASRPPAQEALRRPTRIGGKERAIALGPRRRYRCWRRTIHSASFCATGSDIAASAWVASAGWCLRTNSITFSSASVSAREVRRRRRDRGRDRRLARGAAVRPHAGASRASGRQQPGAVAAVSLAAVFRPGHGIFCGRIGRDMAARSAVASAMEPSAWPTHPPPKPDKTNRQHQACSPMPSTAMRLRGRVRSRVFPDGGIIQSLEP